MGVEPLLMLVGDVAPTSWPPYVTVAFYDQSFAAGSRVGLALDLVSLLQFKMEMSKFCGLAVVLFVLKLPRATVGDIVALYTSDLAFGWLLTKVVPSSWLRCQAFSSGAWFPHTPRYSGLSSEVSWRQLQGLGVLGGIGFTVSLFITRLAFNDPVLIDLSEIGIFAASIVAA